MIGAVIFGGGFVSGLIVAALVRIAVVLWNERERAPERPVFSAVGGLGYAVTTGPLTTYQKLSRILD
jgi:hypothetical protein